jgi:hypothetical protein
MKYETWIRSRRHWHIVRRRTDGVLITACGGKEIRDTWGPTTLNIRPQGMFCPRCEAFVLRFAATKK